MGHRRRRKGLTLSTLVGFLFEIIASPFVLLWDCFSRKRRTGNGWSLRFFGLLIFSTALSYCINRTQEYARGELLERRWPGYYPVASSVPYAALINHWAKTNELDPRLVAAMIAVESSGRAGAVSPKGAKGLMQIMPGTWDEVVSKNHLKVSSFYDPSSNISVGTKYLHELVNRCDGKVGLALIAYNGGLGAVTDIRSRIIQGDFESESSSYVAKVYNEWDKLRDEGDPVIGTFHTHSYGSQGRFYISATISLYAVAAVWISSKLIRNA